MKIFINLKLIFFLFWKQLRLPLAVDCWSITWFPYIVTIFCGCVGFTPDTCNESRVLLFWIPSPTRPRGGPTAWDENLSPFESYSMENFTLVLILWWNLILINYFTLPFTDSINFLSLFSCFLFYHVDSFNMARETQSKYLTFNFLIFFPHIFFVPFFFSKTIIFSTEKGNPWGG